MLEAISRFFKTRGVAVGDAQTDDPTSPSATSVAACALLLELAHSDGECSDEEKNHIESSLVRHFDLDQEAAQELMKLAEVERGRAVDQFRFTNVIAQQFDLGQKLVLAEIMWGVILADGKLADSEGHLVRKIGRMLDLQPGYLAEARKAAAPKPDEGNRS